jgi:hypothetical protein
MQEKSYKLSDLFDGAYVTTTNGSYVCPLKDCVHVFKREIKDLQGLISIIEEHGDGVYVPAHDIIDIANDLCNDDRWSPAQRFKRTITNAIDEWCFVKDMFGSAPTKIKLTEAGANIIEHKKSTTETFDELEMSLAKCAIGKLAELHEEN